MRPSCTLARQMSSFILQGFHRIVEFAIRGSLIRHQKNLASLCAGKNSDQAVVVARRDRIVHVVMAPRAADGQSQSRAEERTNDVVEFARPLFRLRHECVVRSSRAKSRGGDCHRMRRFQLITCNLPSNEVVVGSIIVHRPCDEVTIGICVFPDFILFITIAVGIARNIQPVPRPSFSKDRMRHRLPDESIVVTVVANSWRETPLRIVRREAMHVEAKSPAQIRRCRRSSRFQAG